MRYEHFLAGAKPSPWPDAVLCVSASVSWTEAESGDTRQYAQLTDWHGSLCVRHGDGYALSRSATGRTADDFWEMLRVASLRSKRLLIISSCFREEAVVLGLWDRMESGDAWITGAESRRSFRSEGLVPGVPAAVPGAAGPAREGVDLDPVQPMPAVLNAAARVDRQPGRRRRKASAGVCILEDPPIILSLSISGGKGSVTWVDAANYGVSLPEGTRTVDSCAADLAAWFCRAASTLQSLGKCGWQNTAGSQAMHLYRSVYLADPTLSHTEPRALALESAALFGGRCEALQTGKIGFAVHLLDFRSLYPSLCATRAVPVRLAGVVERPPIAQIMDLTATHCVVASVAIETDEPDYPYRRENDIIYPTGRYWTCLVGEELVHALQSGRVRGVRRAAYYETAPCLARYATEIYAIRCAADSRGDALVSAWAKRLLVALPGKFAQRIAAWEDLPDAESAWEWAEWYSRSESGEPERWRSLAGHIQREVKGGFSHGTVPAISASVCAAGRMRLLAAMHAAGREHTYYCDTDSVIVDDYGLESLTLAGWIKPDEWGWLQHVVSAPECEIFGVKHYRIGCRHRQAGAQGSRGAGGADGARVSAQPPIRDGLRHQQRPPDWRESHPPAALGSTAAPVRPAGGRTKTIEIMEW
jgi:hypothetical protein